jgi:hypothetical protein
MKTKHVSTITITSALMCALASGCVDDTEPGFADGDDELRAASVLFVGQGRDGIEVTDESGQLLSGAIEATCPYTIVSEDHLTPTVDGSEVGSSSCAEGQLDVLSDTALVCACVDSDGVGSTQSCNYGPCSACCAGAVPGGHTPNKEIWVTRPDSCDTANLPIPC